MEGLDFYATHWIDWITGIRIEACRQTSGKLLFAIRVNGDCLGKKGWEYEPLPSNRDCAFLKRCRYENLNAALAATKQAAPPPR